MNVIGNVIPLDRNHKEWNMMRQIVRLFWWELGTRISDLKQQQKPRLVLFQFLFPGFQGKLGNVVQETFSTRSLDDMPLSVLSSGLGLREASAGSKTK